MLYANIAKIVHTKQKRQRGLQISSSSVFIRYQAGKVTGVNKQLWIMFGAFSLSNPLKRLYLLYY